VPPVPPTTQSAGAAPATVPAASPNPTASQAVGLPNSPAFTR
jgi:hypothetical protein